MQPELTESGRLTLTADGRLDLDALLANPMLHPSKAQHMDCRASLREARNDENGDVGAEP